MKPETHSIGKDRTVGKALDILDIIAGFGRPVRYSEVLENCSYPKATLYRFMQTLTNRKMLRYDSERQTYALGLSCAVGPFGLARFQPGADCAATS